MDLGSSIRRRRKRTARTGAGGRRDAGRRAESKRSRGRRAKADGAGAEAPRTRRAGGRSWLAALVVAGVGLGLGHLVAVTLVFPIPDTPIELQGVPDLRGQPLALALSELADSGLTAGRVDSVRHPVVAPGVVFGQSPLPGPTALAAAQVRITVSSGREVRPVPDLTRLGGGRAVELLGAGGFLVAVDTVESTVPAGSVLGMDPEPGTEVALPGTVRVMVSTGPPTFPMPDLSGLTQGEAFALLRSLGLVLEETDRRYSLLNVNVVFGQYPEPNELVVEGAGVRLVVGREVS